MERLNSTFTKKIGNTLFSVSVKSSENAKKQYEEKLKEIIKKETEKPYFSAHSASV